MLSVARRPRLNFKRWRGMPGIVSPARTSISLSPMQLAEVSVVLLLSETMHAGDS